MVGGVIDSRLTKNSLGHIDSLFDFTNAFESTELDELDTGVFENCPVWDARLLNQRHRLSLVKVECPDGALWVQPQCGGRQGCRVEPHKFVHVYSKPAEQLPDAYPQ